MLTNYSAVIEAIVQAGTAADHIKANAASVVASLKAQRETMQNQRETVMNRARLKADSTLAEAVAMVEAIEIMQQNIDAMIAQIEGAQPAAEVV